MSTAAADPTQMIAAKALATAVAVAAAEGAKALGKTTLPVSLSAILAEPIGAVLGSVLQVLISDIFEKTEQLMAAVDRKLDAILSEPLQSARKILLDVSRVDEADAETLAEVERQLDLAYDNLTKALTYAEHAGSGSVVTVRAYLALVAAAKRGGREFAKLHVQALRDTADLVRRKQEALAADVRRLTAEADKEHDMMVNAQEMQSGMSGDPAGRLVFVRAVSALNYRRAAQHADNELKGLASIPEQLGDFCQLIEQIMNDRTILRSGLRKT